MTCCSLLNPCIWVVGFPVCFSALPAFSVVVLYQKPVSICHQLYPVVQGQARYGQGICMSPLLQRSTLGSQQGVEDIYGQRCFCGQRSYLLQLTPAGHAVQGVLLARGRDSCYGSVLSLSCSNTGVAWLSGLHMSSGRCVRWLTHW